MDRNRIILLAAIAALVVAFFALGLDQYFTLEYFKSRQAEIDAFVTAHPLASALGFFTIYVLATAVSIPGAAVMTLAAGAIFGLLWGTVLVSFASSIGATLAFLVGRFLFHDTVQRRFRSRLEAINRGVRKDGAFYLFALRLVPAFPFVVINLAMALTPMRAPTFYIVSQAGMLPGTIVYVNAGTQIAQVDSTSGFLSPELIGSFVLLAIFPLIAKKILEMLKARKLYKGWPRPRRFDRDMVVLGAGSAGLVAAYIATTVRASVSLVEKNKMGGDCLNTGCVPSKSLIRTARFVADARRSDELGIHTANVDFDFADVMERVQRVIRTIEPHDSVERFTSLGVDCLHGQARITSPWTVEVDGRELTTRSIVVATGAAPFVPPIPGIDDVGYYTSDTIWELRSQPKRLVVLGGGSIGCELSQAFARLGTEVTQVEMLDRVMPREDPEISEMVRNRFEAEGVDVRVGHKARSFHVEGGRKVMICERDGEEVRIEFDELLVALGRKPNTAGFGLEELGIPVTDAGTIEVDEHLRARYPNIYACGDVAGPYQFTHTASHQAWYAAVNALFGGFRKFKADYSVIPWTTFTDPEVAHVGLNETEATERGIDYEVTTYDIAELDRAITDEAAEGVVKVLTEPGKDRVLGATIAGEHAGELIIEYIAAMRHGFGLNKILGTIHTYPTMVEANKFAAGEWKKARAPETVLRWLGRYFAWRRGDRQPAEQPG